MPSEHSWPPKTLILPPEEWSFEILEIKERGEEYVSPDGFTVFHPLQQVARVKMTPTRPDLGFLLSDDLLRRWFLEVDGMMFIIYHVLPCLGYGIAYCQRPLET